MRRGLAVAGFALTLCACSRPSSPPDGPPPPLSTTAHAEAPPAPDAPTDAAEFGRLNREYSEALAQAMHSPVLTPATRAQLMDAQMAFARRRATCPPGAASQACLIAVYRERITQLRAYAPIVH